MEPDPIHWEDVIEIKRDDGFLKNKTPAEMEQYQERLERFLDYVENTEQGQELLQSLQDKYGDIEGHSGKVDIHLVDQGSSITWPDGSIMLDVTLPQYLAFLDAETRQAVPLSFERQTFHELVHSADNNLKFGVWYDDPNSEEYATQQTDAFARDYMPELGQRGVYDNVAGQQPDDIIDMEAISGMDQITTNPSVRIKLEGLLVAPPIEIDLNTPYKEADQRRLDPGVMPDSPSNNTDAGTAAPQDDGMRAPLPTSPSPGFN